MTTTDRLTHRVESVMALAVTVNQQHRLGTHVQELIWMTSVSGLRGGNLIAPAGKYATYQYDRQTSTQTQNAAQTCKQRQAIPQT